jgi:HK97 family phage portal protein
MNLIQKAMLWAAQKAVIASGLSLTDPRLTRFFGQPTYTGKVVTQEAALGVSTVFSCTRVTAETFGMLPLRAYKIDAKTKNAVEVDTPSRQVLVDSPNVDMSDVEFKETCGANLCLAGNFYALIDRNGVGDISSLYPIESHFVTPYRNQVTREITYNITDRGKTEPYPREKIWHVKGFGSNGLVGLSPLGYARQAVGLAMATEEFGARFFGNGTHPSMVFSVPEWLKKENRAEAYKRLEDFHSGLTNAHKPFIMEGGMTYTNVQMPLDDAQFLVTRKFTIAEICRFYRVPLHMVMEFSEGGTKASLEQQALEFVTNTLMPYMVRYERSISKWLLTPKEKAQGIFYAFDASEFLRADTDARSNFYARMVQNGIYSRNEVRAKERMPRIAGLDKFTVQSNMTDVDKMDDLVQSSTQAPNSSEASQQVIKQ